MPLAIKVEKKDKGTHVISLAGSLDSNTYIDLENKLGQIIIASTKVLILNLAGLRYISSMGVSLIFTIKKNMEAFGNSFIMVNLQPQIKRVFEIVNALPLVPVFESLEDADRYLAEMQKKALEGRED